MKQTDYLKRSALFLLFGVIFQIQSQSQITIGKGDMPKVGDTPISSIADTLQFIDTESSGPNSVWDFSNLKHISQRKDSFLSVPFLYQLFFTGADVVQFLPTPDSIGPIAFKIGYRFFNSRNDRYEDMGIGLELDQAPLPVSLRNNPEDIIYHFSVVLFKVGYQL